MIRTVLTRTMMTAGVFVLCLTLSACEESSSGPQGQAPPPETPPAGTTIAPAPGGDVTPTSVQGASGATRGGGT